MTSAALPAAPVAKIDMRYAWAVVGLLTLAQVVSYIDRFLPSLLIGPIKADLHLSDFQIGLILGPAFGFFYVFVGIPIGWLADRWSRRTILSVGVTFWSLMTAAGALARSFGALFGARLGVGLGEACLSPCAVSLISDYFPRAKRARAFSVYMAGTFIGAGTAFLVGGLFVQYLGTLPPFVLPGGGALKTWQTAFLVIGAPGLVLALLMLLIREPKRSEYSRGAVGAASLLGAAGYIAKRWRAFGALFLGSSFVTVTGAFSTWNVALFQRTWDWSVRDVGVAIGLLYFTAGPLGTVLSLVLSNRGIAKGRKDATLRTLLTGIAIAFPAYVLYPQMPSAPLSIFCLFFAFVGQAIATASGPASLALIAPGELRSQATAVYFLVISGAGQLLGPPPLGWMSDVLGNIRHAISIEAIVVGLPVLVLLSLGLRRYRDEVAALEDCIVGTVDQAPAHG
jgi:MFS family permease